MDLNEISKCIRNNQYIYSQHAEIGRREDGLTFAQVEEALLNGRVLDEYPGTGRGVSCLVVGLSHNAPIHAVRGWRGEKLVLITVYIPRPPKFIDPWTRGGRNT